jgi:sugar lactone lactonase YvrE
MPFEFDGVFGVRRSTPSPPESVADPTFAMSSPVGVAQDRAGRVWVADTGHNRLLVLSRALDRLVATIGSHGTAPGEFALPVRIAHHPTSRLFYVTDVGNQRVQAIRYEQSDPGLTTTAEVVVDVGDVATDGCATSVGDAQFHPNGIAVHEYDDGIRLFVGDEFYHAVPTDPGGRVLVFDDEGTQVSAFEAIDHEDGAVPLYWPQGMTTDGEGNLYVANTGYGVLHGAADCPEYYANVVRCDRSGTGVPFDFSGDVTLEDHFGLPRDVGFAPGPNGGHVLVPDSSTGQLTAYRTDGLSVGSVPPYLELDDRLPRANKGEVPAPEVPDGTDHRFAMPAAVTGYEPPTAVDDEEHDLQVLVTESRVPRVAGYGIETIGDHKPRLTSVTGLRDDPGQLSFPSATAQVDSTTFPQWVTDTWNGRLQHSGVSDDVLTPVGVLANEAPVGICCWRVDDREWYLFAADSTHDSKADRSRGQIHVYHVNGYRGTPTLTHVESFGTWGLWDEDVRFPHGLAVDPLGPTRTHVYVADSYNGRIARWRFDTQHADAHYEAELGEFGHGVGEFWAPSDVAVAGDALVVADRFNNRLQVHDERGWHVVGQAGYGADGANFLQPVSVAYEAGYCFVTDLVNRALKVFAVESRGGRIDLSFVDSSQSFGGDPQQGSFWTPALLSVTSRSNTYEVLVPDATLNAAYRYVWTPP